MPKPFKLVEDEFSKEYNERWWTYEFEIVFNKNRIISITITNHYLKSGHDKQGITNELILELLEKLNSWRLEPTKYQGKRKVYKWEIVYREQRYRFWFWFKDGAVNHLWIRNCYPID